jgi:hypothetical protein
VRNFGLAKLKSKTGWQAFSHTAPTSISVQEASEMSSDDQQISSNIRKLLGKRPIIAGEDPADYDLLTKLVRRDVRPQALQEWLLMKDIVDAEWELLRLRGLKVTMLHAMVPRAVGAQRIGLRPLDEDKWVPPLRGHLVGILAGDPAAKQELEKLLKAEGLTLDVIIATAFEKTIVAQVHTDRMAAAAYDRRNAAYAELERVRGKRDPDADLEEWEEEEAPPTAPVSGSSAAGREHQTSSNGLGKGQKRSL